MKPKKNERILHICAGLEQEFGRKVFDSLLAGVGARTATIADAGLTAMQEATLLRNACRKADDQSLAARIGISFHQASTLTAYIARSSATLRAAIINAAPFYGLSDASTEFSLSVREDHDVMLVHTPEGALQRHPRFQEFRVFGLLARLRSIAGVDFHPSELCFRHELNVDTRPYEKLAGCRVVFAGAFNGIRFHPGALDRPLATHDPELVEYLRELASEQMRKSGRREQTFRARVESILIGALPGRIIPADEVSSELGMTRRTLTRQLNREGTTFRAVVEDLRFDLAKTLLRDGLSISETAFYLGYNDHAAFSTAFRRWEGRSPRAYLNGI